MLMAIEDMQGFGNCNTIRRLPAQPNAAVRKLPAVPKKKIARPRTVNTALRLTPQAAAATTQPKPAAVTTTAAKTKQVTQRVKARKLCKCRQKQGGGLGYFDPETLLGVEDLDHLLVGEDGELYGLGGFGELIRYEAPGMSSWLSKTFKKVTGTKLSNVAGAIASAVPVVGGVLGPLVSAVSGGSGGEGGGASSPTPANTVPVETQLKNARNNVAKQKTEIETLKKHRTWIMAGGGAALGAAVLLLAFKK